MFNSWSSFDCNSALALTLYSNYAHPHIIVAYLHVCMQLSLQTQTTVETETGRYSNILYTQTFRLPTVRSYWSLTALDPALVVLGIREEEIGCCFKLDKPVQTVGDWDDRPTESGGCDSQRLHSDS